MLNTDETLPINQESILTVQALASSARLVNARNGWGFTEAHLMDGVSLVHDEVSEAFEELLGEPHADLLCAPLKPWPLDPDALDRLRKEIGDVIVRCLDLLEQFGPGESATHVGAAQLNLIAGAAPADPVYALMYLHLAASRVVRAYRVSQVGTVGAAPARLGEVVRVAARVLRLMEVQDVDALVADIVRANARRTFRHGGKRI